MKKYKISIFFTVFLILPALFSCQKKLNLEPVANIDANDATQNIEAILLGAYALIGSGDPNWEIPLQGIGSLYGTDLILDPELLDADSNVIWTGSFSQYRDISDKSMVSTNLSATNVWRKAYQAINTANVVLDNISQADVIDQDQFMGEALFIRGIMHFELVRLYALQYDASTLNSWGIPLLLNSTPIAGPVPIQGRATVGEVYNQVLADLHKALSLLPEKSPSGRANKFVANGFLARVYLQMGDFANALDKADSVIQRGPYSLIPSVVGIYNQNQTSESIFEIQQTTQQNAGTVNDGLYTFFGCQGDNPAGKGRGDVVIDSAIYNLYDPADERRINLFYTGYGCNKAGKLATGKWKAPYNDFIIMRLAEMYLIRAEANYRLGTSQGATAQEDLDRIKKRANTPLTPILSAEDIFLERRRELAFEGFAIHDKRRLKKSTYAGGTEYAWDSPELVFPIPLKEINANPAIAGQQNPGY